MASSQEFIKRINEIEGVAGCLLTRSDGTILGQTKDLKEELASLMAISCQYGDEIMNKAGFSYCRFLSFNRLGGNSFHVFQVHQYFLGVIQTPDCSLAEMTNKISNLLGRVKDTSSKN